MTFRFSDSFFGQFFAEIPTDWRQTCETFHPYYIPNFTDFPSCRTALQAYNMKQHIKTHKNLSPEEMAAGLNMAQLKHPNSNFMDDGLMSQ